MSTPEHAHNRPDRTGAGAMVRQYYDHIDELGYAGATTRLDEDLRSNPRLTPFARYTVMKMVLTDEMNKLDRRDPNIKILQGWWVRNADEKLRYDHARRRNSRHCRKH